MQKPHPIAIIGTGYCVPEEIRTNDDPVFDWLNQHQPPGSNLFYGYDQRRVLPNPGSMAPPPNNILDLMVTAAQAALDDADLKSTDIDLLLGYGSVSEFVSPNVLAHVHARLGMSSSAVVLPLHDEFTNFNTGVVVAQSLIQTGQAKRALIVCAANWSQYVDYYTSPAISVADGAGAAVVAHTNDTTRFSFVDFENYTESADYGQMFIAGDPVRNSNGDCTNTFSRPYFHLTEAGQVSFSTFGEQAPPAVTNRLLARNNLTGADISLISHQSSQSLLQAWNEAIQPAQYLQTLKTFANVELATIPLNLAYLYDQIEKDYLVLLGIGIHFHTNAVLLRRNPTQKG
ncbi:MAG: hypothetical protein H6728_13385 [Myxococcales bacterium]|nr:hypothetical protein [Myxococcales bacterium]MCB9644062.1 hypothetical protein [Myxococcales bacterium]